MKATKTDLVDRSNYINLESLPLHIYKKIPLSIKTYKSEYELHELPFNIQNLIRDHINQKEIKYNTTVFDGYPRISKYGDLEVIPNITELILEYIHNYFKTSRGEYPFNGQVGSNLKRLLQKKDTMIQNLRMGEELNNMVNAFNLEKKYKNSVRVKNFDLKRTNKRSHSEYHILLNLVIDDEPKTIDIEYVI